MDVDSIHFSTCYLDAFIVRLHCLPKHCFPLLVGKVGTASSDAANNPYQTMLRILYNFRQKKSNFKFFQVQNYILRKKITFLLCITLWSDTRGKSRG